MGLFRTGSRRLARELRTALLDLLLPPHCPGCGAGASELAPQSWLCGPCAAHLQGRPEVGCRRCGEPTTAEPCRQDHRWLQGIAWARAPFRYAGTGGALVRRLKLSGDFGALPALASAMVRAAAPALVGDWRRAAVVAVPIDRARRRLRGFDQARLLGAEVARRGGLTFLAGCLCRRRETLPQGDPRVTSREANVAGAFGVARGRRLPGQHVLLVDDVATSGATARACAAALVAAGARRVALLTACRA